MYLRDIDQESLIDICKQFQALLNTLEITCWKIYKDCNFQSFNQREQSKLKKQEALQIYLAQIFKVQQAQKQKLAMNFANYSPYNKSYRFICFQNQAYHQKNKTNASPCVKTNIRYLMNRSSDNPEAFSQRRSQSSHRFSRSNNSDLISSEKFSNSMIRSVSLGNALISQEKRVVHKNQSFEKFRLRKMSHQNIQMVNRLLQAQCQVVKKKQTEKSFQNHLKYREIRKKYNDQGLRKTKMCLGNSQLLCPTLLDYNRSGMAQKFVQMDLSMSMVPSTASSRMRKKRSDNEYMHESQNDL